MPKKKKKKIAGTGKLKQEKLAIYLNEEDTQSWKSVLRAWIVNVKARVINVDKVIRSEATLTKYIDDKFDKVLKGWNNNPVEIESRLKQVFGFDTADPNTYIPKRWEEKNLKLKTLEEKVEDYKKEFEKLDETYDLISQELLELFELDPKEIALTLSRLNNYLKSYVFNSANDRMTLKNLLIEEIYLDRENSKRLKLSVQGRERSKDLSEIIDKCQKNISKMQEDLGITAKLRQDEESNRLTLPDIYKIYQERIKDPNFIDDLRQRKINQMIVIYRQIKAGILSRASVPSFFPGHNYDTIESEINYGVTKGWVKIEDLKRPTLRDKGVLMDEKP